MPSPSSLRATSEPLPNLASNLSSVQLSYPIPPDNLVGAPFAQAGFSGRESARRNPSHRASTPAPLERSGTHSCGRLPRRSPRRAPRRARDDKPPEPPSPLTRRGPSTLPSVFALLPRLLPPLPTHGVAAQLPHDATRRRPVPWAKDYSPKLVEVEFCELRFETV
jgi:hypothetical protein